MNGENVDKQILYFPRKMHVKALNLPQKVCAPCYLEHLIRINLLMLKDFERFTVFCLLFKCVAYKVGSYCKYANSPNV